jgi:hypothetical protein
MSSSSSAEPTVKAWAVERLGPARCHRDECKLIYAGRGGAGMTEGEVRAVIIMRTAKDSAR